MVVVASGEADGDHAGLSGDGDIIVGTEGRAENLVIPIGIGVANECLLRLGAVGIDDIDELAAAEHIGELIGLLEAVGG